MNKIRYTAMALIGAGLAWLGLTAATQNEERYKTRLAPVAIDLAMRANIAGNGTAAAVLAGNKLSINGSFEGLRTPATVAHLHQGRGTGVRGPIVFDLIVTRATSGSISGSFELTAEQVESLRKGRFYVQINSEKAPDGNLWGWLLH